MLPALPCTTPGACSGTWLSGVDAPSGSWAIAFWSITYWLLPVSGDNALRA